MPDLCMKLAQNVGFVEHAELYVQDIPREDATEKVTNLICRLHDLIQEMSHVETLMSTPTTRLLMDYAHIMDSVPFIFSAIVIFFVR